MKMRNVFTGLLLSSMLLLAPCQAGLINWDVAPSNVDYLTPTQVNSSDSGTDFVDSFTFRNASPALAVNGVTFNRYTSSAGNTASFDNSGITVFLGTNNTAVLPATLSPMANSTVNSYGAILSQAGLVLAPADAYIH